MSKINVNTWEPEGAGTAATLMATGDTVTVPSGATLAIASGATLSNSGTATGFSSITWQSAKTTDFTAVAGEGYPVNTTSGVITATLPTPPTVGDTIEFVDYAGTFDSNALTIAPGGSDKLKGTTDSQVFPRDRSGATLTFIDATQGWISTSGINEGTAALGIPTYSSEVLMTAGGGGGYNSITNGGGGGGGGLLYYGAETPKTPNGVALVLQFAEVYTVQIGAGGTRNADGNDTVFSGGTYTGGAAKTAVGGGEGDSSPGGSGGGRKLDGSSGVAGGAGTTGQGNAGGSSSYVAPGYPTGGGGGAGAVGGNASGGSAAGNGGAGLDYVITGSSVNYAAGGGGGGYAVISAGYGSAGGDSAGAGGVSAPDGRGGGAGAGKDGGNGCVILRMLATDYSGIITGAPTVSTDGLYKVLNFIVSGSYTA